MMKRFVAIVLMLSLMLVMCIQVTFAQGTVEEYYKNQLSNDEKNIYEAFLRAATTGNEQISGLTSVNLSFTATRDIVDGNDLNAYLSSDSSVQQELSKLNGMFYNAITSAMMDHPEYYWIDNHNAAQLAYGANSRGREITLSVSIQTSNKTNSQQLLQQVESKFASMNATGNNIEKIKAIHKWLCDNVSYVSGTNSHNLYGALFEGKAVCQGYAEAFKAACDYYGIRCVCVEGVALNTQGQSEGHMWNYVEIDGYWYAIDVTWDDQTSGIMEDFFLVGSSTKAEHFDNKTFAESHSPDGRLGGTSQKIFNYPALSLKAYGSSANTSAPVQTLKPNPTTKAPTVTVAPATKAPEVTEAPTTNTAQTTAGVTITPEHVDEGTTATDATETPIGTNDVTPTVKADVAPVEDGDGGKNVYIIPVAVVAIAVILGAVIIIKKKK